MITSKQRAFLRSAANKMDAVLQLGKSGLTPEIAESVNEALEKRELVKITVLNTCAEEPAGLAETLSARTRSDVVQIIGKKIVLYRKSKTKPVIQLPDK